jgi:hypothetical protein
MLEYLALTISAISFKSHLKHISLHINGALLSRPEVKLPPRQGVFVAGIPPSTGLGGYLVSFFAGLFVLLFFSLVQLFLNIKPCKVSSILHPR